MLFPILYYATINNKNYWSQEEETDPSKRDKYFIRKQLLRKCWK